MAVGDRVVKAYDLRAFDAYGRIYAFQEVENALAVSDLPGVITTYRAGEVGDWMVLEMERMGISLADYVADVAAGTRLPLSLSQWGVLFAEVTRALDQIHQRKVVHNDIKPANLMFDRAGERLIVGDFSIAARRRRLLTRDWESDEGAHGTYVAPQQFDGTIGRAVDQYALAVTAGEVGAELPHQHASCFSARPNETTIAIRASLILAIRCELRLTGQRRAQLP